MSRVARGLNLGVESGDYMVQERYDDLAEWQGWREPDWDAGSHVHNWRTHVPEFVQTIWLEFPVAHRYALFRWADQLAGAEEWE